ncbi:MULTISPECIES: hypothetical protein [Cellulophaga]|uniref:hypothetical protein n=1 Tax=Cellulophaga TaxID=104264 RepID=UPI0009505BAB|nr:MULTISPECIES: hypothetical protein [Cellulophaga]APU11770.1 hypothetical protein A5M85_16230 [Cellulophaga lytica]WBU89222.1 hypothetical protein PBN93_15290 [Cellulophaga omnivescoria]
MLERLLLKHLTKKGKIGYFVGVVVLFALLAVYLFGIADYSMDRGRNPFFIGMIIINLSWAGISYALWKKPKEEEIENTPHKKEL